MVEGDRRARDRIAERRERPGMGLGAPGCFGFIHDLVDPGAIGSNEGMGPENFRGRLSIGPGADRPGE